MDVLKAYLDWRRRAFPASKTDLDWRVAEIAHRLDEMRDRLDSLGHTQAAVLARVMEPPPPPPPLPPPPEPAPARSDAQGSPKTQRCLLDLLRLLSPCAADGVTKVRVGSAHDGGYVQLDDISTLQLTLSFGVGDNDSWDVAMAEKGLSVQQFDHTVEAAPSSHPLLSFHRKEVATVSSATCVSLSELVEGLPEDRPSVILKMDIEGAEWDVLDQARESDLAKIAQFVCEFHSLSELRDLGFYCRARRVLEKLNNHFAVVHVHGNNFGGLENVHNIALPEVIEVSFASRRLYSFSPCAEIFPTPLDAPNDPTRADIFLGRFQF